MSDNERCVAQVSGNLLRLLYTLLGYCARCRRWFVYPRRRRMNTAYADDGANFCVTCLRCYEEIEEYWTERWDEYYASVL